MESTGMKRNFSGPSVFYANLVGITIKAIFNQRVGIGVPYWKSSMVDERTLPRWDRDKGKSPQSFISKEDWLSQEDAHRHRQRSLSGFDSSEPWRIDHGVISPIAYASDRLRIGGPGLDLNVVLIAQTSVRMLSIF